eukprot:3659453-Rhodomonas_salina.2
MQISSQCSLQHVADQPENAMGAGGACSWVREGQVWMSDSQGSSKPDRFGGTEAYFSWASLVALGPRRFWFHFV